METFLNQPEATFYHITTLERWNTIQEQGFRCNGRIFVSRTAELPVILAIAIEQLLGIDEVAEIAVIKFPQARNNFTVEEIIPDDQAQVEWTQPFQNIILREFIPIDNIELMMTIRLGADMFRTLLMTEFARISNQGAENYPNHFLTQRAAQLVYHENNDADEENL